MIPKLLLALAVAAQAGDDAPSLPMIPDDAAPPAAAAAAREPGLHKLRIVGPRECWVWSVEQPDGRFRPVEYRPTPASPTAPAARPSFETNGVIAARLATDGRTIRASDATTLAEVTAVVEAGRRKPSPPTVPDVVRAVAAAAFPWEELLLYAAGLALCLVGFVLAVRSVLRRPS